MYGPLNQGTPVSVGLTASDMVPPDLECGGPAGLSLCPRADMMHRRGTASPQMACSWVSAFLPRSGFTRQSPTGFGALSGFLAPRRRAAWSP